MSRGDYTKAKSITMRTKERVHDRQNGKSLLSQSPISVNECCCHYVGRGRSGVGYEWNIIGLLPSEHFELDNHLPITFNGEFLMSNEKALELIYNHLSGSYDGWSIEKCKYKKYWKEEDYGVTRKWMTNY